MDTFFGVGLVGAVANSFVMPNMAAAVMDSSPPERRAQALVRAHFLCPPLLLHLCVPCWRRAVVGTAVALARLGVLMVIAAGCIVRSMIRDERGE
eukprot:COSAG01_NODE_1511_length_10068_cov_7.643731_8_plen_95_part_00